MISFFACLVTSAAPCPKSIPDLLSLSLLTCTVSPVVCYFFFQAEPFLRLPLTSLLATFSGHARSNSIVFLLWYIVAVQFLLYSSSLLILFGQKVFNLTKASCLNCVQFLIDGICHFQGIGNLQTQRLPNIPLVLAKLAGFYDCVSDVHGRVYIGCNLTANVL